MQFFEITFKMPISILQQSLNLFWNTLLNSLKYPSNLLETLLRLTWNFHRPILPSYAAILFYFIFIFIWWIEPIVLLVGDSGRFFASRNTFSIKGADLLPEIISWPAKQNIFVDHHFHIHLIWFLTKRNWCFCNTDDANKLKRF